MVAYNFQKQFVEPIRLGHKTHTIRRLAKRRHAEPGEALQLYTAQRTKYCQKIIDPDPVCTHSLPIQIEVLSRKIGRVIVEQSGLVKVIGHMELFATDDGFANLQAFFEFWLDFHGTGMFVGRLISWGDLNLSRWGCE